MLVTGGLLQRYANQTAVHANPSAPAVMYNRAVRAAVEVVGNSRMANLLGAFGRRHTYANEMPEAAATGKEPVDGVGADNCALECAFFGKARTLERSTNFV